MKKYNSSILIIIFVIILILIATIGNNCLAQGTTGGSSVKLEDPLGNKPPQVLIGQAINGVLGLVGSIALAMFIYGGFTWMLSSGKPEAVTKGKNILTWSIIGMVVIFSAYAIIQFVFKNVLGMN